ncbi:MAG TPA: AsmA-like C-terminal region-containing protein, partial [Candidatus Angelobacter sp.]|nr:AsmA-like C-terminal region-containing protein [Candidatus Angelobacter sp.]
QPVHVNDIEVTLTPDTIRSNDFAASTGSTTVNANFTVSNYLGNNSTINAALRAPNAKMSEILEIAAAAGVSATKGVSGSGTLSLDVRAQGPTKNLSALNFSGAAKISNAQISEFITIAKNAGVTAVNGVSGDGILNLDMHAQGQAKNLSALNFSGTGKISNANLKLPSLTKPLQVRNSDIQFSKNSIVLQNVSTGLGQATANGALTVKNFDAPVVQFTLNAGGPLGEILELARTAGVSAVEGISGDGTLAVAVHGQGPIKNMSALDLSGTGKISNANLKLPSLTKPLQVRNSDIQFSKNSIGLQNVNAGIGQTNANGTLALRNFDAPQVQFTLNFDKVNITELRQIFNAAPAQPKRAALEHDLWSIMPKAEAQAPVNNSPQPSLLTKMTGGGTVTIGTIQYDDLILNNAHSNVTLDHGLIKLNPTTADVYGGKESGAVTIDMRPAQPVYTVNLKTDKVDANKLVSSVSDLKQTLYGMLASNVNAAFSSSSASSIARSLNGTMAINLTNGKLMNINLLHELASVGKFVGANFDAAKNFTDLAQLTGNFDVKNGVAQTNNLNAVIDGGTLAAAGLVNLADQSLNLHVTTVLNKALSQQVGGTQVGGYMNTALANNQGELVMPVIITGTFQHPHVAPDVQQIAQMKLKNMLPNTKNPAELTTGILGAVLGGKNQGGAAGQPANGQSKGGIGGILDAISGKQQQQNQQNQQQQNPAIGNNEGQQQNQPQQQEPNQPQQQSTPANQGQEQQQSQPQQQASPAEGANQAQQPTATPTPAAPNLGDVLNQVLNRKKKDQATPTPTPPQ